jgi:hypothetical protein
MRSVKQERDTTGEREGKNFDFDRRLLRNFNLAERNERVADRSKNDARCGNGSVQ